MIRRARLVAVLSLLGGGALALISSTQPWLTVAIDDGARDELVVLGSAAVPVLAPLSLAVLALAAALSIVGTALRYVFGLLGTAIGALIAVQSWRTAAERPVTAVAGSVTEATGITGIEAIASLVQGIASTPWPALTVGFGLLVVAAGILTLGTAQRWAGSGRRYRTDAPTAAAAGSRPHDAIDSWDDLSRGDDPTDR